jgi:cell division septal protein FtsQ
MEGVVEKNPWVKNAEMFLDNNQVLQVMIEERQPVARCIHTRWQFFLPRQRRDAAAPE